MTLTGLLPSTTYHVRTVASSSAGTAAGVDRTFTTPPPPLPLAIPNPASQVTQTGAVLNGLVNPYGSSTTYRFEWGTSTAYGNGTTSMGMGAVLSGERDRGPAERALAEHHLPLPDHRHERLGHHPQRRRDVHLPAPAAAGRGDRRRLVQVTRSSATLAGTVTPNGQSASYRIEYGTGRGLRLGHELGGARLGHRHARRERDHLRPERRHDLPLPGRGPVRQRHRATGPTRPSRPCRRPRRRSPPARRPASAGRPPRCAVRSTRTGSRRPRTSSSGRARATAPRPP